LQAPNPGSYPPKEGEVGDSNSPKNGWTMVRTVRDRNNNEVLLNEEPAGRDPVLEPDLGAGDVEVEGDMILGDLEPEMTVSDARTPMVSFQPQPKYNTGADSIRRDVDAVVAGGYAFSWYSLAFVDIHRSFNRDYQPHKTKRCHSKGQNTWS
jgi:hypothetical protein